MELLVFPLLGIIFVLIFVREVIAPASRNHCDRRWLILAGSMALITVLATLAGGYLLADSIRRFALWQAHDYLPVWLVGLLSFLLTSFIFYWWHRATHQFDWLWRYFHQLHHSARRVEALTAFYAHPHDTLAAVLLSSFSSYLVLGANPLAAALALFLTGLFDLFLHSDLNTPRWLGYLIQRPEMHTVHHAYQHHADNYGLPIWDILFGTWNNPLARSAELGFAADKSERISDMLLCQDVHKPRAEKR